MGLAAGALALLYAPQADGLVAASEFVFQMVIAIWVYFRLRCPYCSNSLFEHRSSGGFMYYAPWIAKQCSNCQRSLIE